MGNIKSRKAYRFKDNPMERRFFEAWVHGHERIGNRCNSTVDYLMANDPNHPNGEATERDHEVARAIIQWLGSPVGMCFLRDVGFVHEEPEAKPRRVA